MLATHDRPTGLSPKALGRATAALLLTMIVLGISAQVGISDRLISPGDAERTAAAILGNLSLYRAGFTLYLIEMAAQVAGTVLLFFLLKPVSRRVATLALVFGLIGCTIKTFSRVFYLAPLFVLGRDSLGAFGPDQLPALSLMLLSVNERGAGVALGFFGIETILEGWLIMQSTFLPRWLGVLITVGGIGWLSFLSPTLGYALFNAAALVALIGAGALIGWLFFKGVDEERWLAMERQ